MADPLSKRKKLKAKKQLKNVLRTHRQVHAVLGGFSGKERLSIERFSIHYDYLCQLQVKLERLHKALPLTKHLVDSQTWKALC